MPFAPIPLPYDYNALSSKGLSEEQITFHYDKHHKSYATKLNAAVQADPSLASKTLVEIIKTTKGPVFNSAGQLFNHDIYWQSLSPEGGGMPTGAIAKAIDESFGTFEKFKEEFNAAATGHFGSGWAWLVNDTTCNKLKVYQSHDGGCPLTENHLEPLLACDVWEHAYYIDYRNERPAYVKAWWNMVNWKYAESQLKSSARL